MSATVPQFWHTPTSSPVAHLCSRYLTWPGLIEQPARKSDNGSRFGGLPMGYRQKPILQFTPVQPISFTDCSIGWSRRR